MPSSHSFFPICTIFTVLQIGHNPLHHVAHYLKNAVTLESKADERRRESVIADHAHVNDHGGRQAEAEFWDKHGKGSAHGERSGDGHDHGHGHVTVVNEPVGHVTARNEKAGGGSVTGTLF
jgi:hypothetical protein